MPNDDIFYDVESSDIETLYSVSVTVTQDTTEKQYFSFCDTRQCVLVDLSDTSVMMRCFDISVISIFTVVFDYWFLTLVIN